MLALLQKIKTKRKGDFLHYQLTFCKVTPLEKETETSVIQIVLSRWADSDNLHLIQGIIFTWYFMASK